jgi:hypothetical protein
MATTAPKTAAHVEQKQTDISPLLEEIARNTQRYDAARFAPKSADELWDLAEQWYYSGLLPEAYYPKEGGKWHKDSVAQGVRKAVIVMRYGASLGVLPEQSIRQIYIVEGQPSPSASLMLSMAFASKVLAREDWRIATASPTKVVVELFGRTRAKPEIIETKIEDYKHLAGKKNWQHYPEDMLVARATSRAMRRYFPDMFAGVYAAEERVDMRQDRAAGRVEDATDRILAMVDEPARDEPSPPPAAQSSVPAEAASPSDDDAAVALVLDAETKIAAVVSTDKEHLSFRDAVAACEAVPAGEARERLRKLFGQRLSKLKAEAQAPQQRDAAQEGACA